MWKQRHQSPSWQQLDVTAGYYLTWPYRLVHEGCHYVAARLLGLPAQLDLRQGYVTYTAPHPHDRRIRVALLAPAGVGCLSLAALAVVSWLTAGWGLFWLGLLWHLFWWFWCLGDLADLWHYAQHGRWPTRPLPPAQTVEGWLWTRAQHWWRRGNKHSGRGR